MENPKGNKDVKSFKPAQVPDFPEANDFEQCNLDCASCEREYDSSIVKSIDMDLPLYGGVSPFSVHLGCLTGRDDWQHDIAAEIESPASRISDVFKNYAKELEAQDRIVLTNISMEPSIRTKSQTGTDIMVLGPAWSMVTNVADGVPAIDQFVKDFVVSSALSLPTSSGLYQVRRMGFQAVILICSHMRRDARCGKTAPVLYDEFDEQLRERDLLFDPDEHTSEEGRVLVGFVSHIGGHKFAGNVLIYRRDSTGKTESIWLGRVFPHHVKHIVEETVLKGKVYYPLLRGGVIW